MAQTVNIVRTAVVTDPLARANVMATLGGRGAPAGITAVSADGATVIVHFDADRTSVELVEALIAVAAEFVPADLSLDDRDAVIAIAARGLREPELDASRIIETYLT